MIKYNIITVKYSKNILNKYSKNVRTAFVPGVKFGLCEFFSWLRLCLKFILAFISTILNINTLISSNLGMIIPYFPNFKSISTFQNGNFGNKSKIKILECILDYLNAKLQIVFSIESKCF